MKACNKRKPGNTAAEEAAIEEAFVEEAVVQKDAVESLLTSCCFCKLSNKTSRALRLHKKFSHRKELREFEEEHRETTGQSVTSTKLVCEKCNFAAENSESLRTHGRQKHRVFDCELCAFSSSSENGLNIHITKAHSKFQEEGKVCEIEQRYNAMNHGTYATSVTILATLRLLLNANIPGKCLIIL